MKNILEQQKRYKNSEILEFDTTMSPEEVLGKIAASINRPKPLFDLGGEELVGKVNKDKTFYIRKRWNRFFNLYPLWYHNSFERVLYGQVVPTNTGAKVIAQFKSYLFLKIFKVFWIIACSFFVLLGLLVAVTAHNSDDRGGGFIFLFIAVAFILFYYFFEWLGISMSKRGEDEIKKLLETLFSKPS